MNPIITFPHPVEPSLRLPRASAEQWAETLAEERRRLHEDHEALREREENLREYEARLRTLQAEIEASRKPAAAPRAMALGYSYTPSAAAPGTVPAFQRPTSTPQDDTALAGAWEKLHRAREILEAEQNHMRDERIVLREQQTAVKVREVAVAEREARMAEREAQIAEMTPAQEAVVEPETAEQATEATPRSAVSKLTMAPFNMARSMFGKKS